MASYNPDEMSSDELACPICFEDFSMDLSTNRAPKLLMCLHTFCLGCVRSLVKTNRTIQCSMCRAEHSDVVPTELFDNYVIIDYLKKLQEKNDAQYAHEQAGGLESQEQILAKFQQVPVIVKVEHPALAAKENPAPAVKVTTGPAVKIDLLLPIKVTPMPLAVPSKPSCNRPAGVRSESSAIAAYIAHRKISPTGYPKRIAPQPPVIQRYSAPLSENIISVTTSGSSSSANNCDSSSTSNSSTESSSSDTSSSSRESSSSRLNEELFQDTVENLDKPIDASRLICGKAFHTVINSERICPSCTSKKSSIYSNIIGESSGSRSSSATLLKNQISLRYINSDCSNDDSDSESESRNYEEMEEDYSLQLLENQAVVGSSNDSFHFNADGAIQREITFGPDNESDVLDAVADRGVDLFSDEENISDNSEDNDDMIQDENDLQLDDMENILHHSSSDEDDRPQIIAEFPIIEHEVINLSIDDEDCIADDEEEGLNISSDNSNDVVISMDANDNRMSEESCDDSNESESSLSDDSFLYN